MDIKGMTINFLGDSITQGCGTSSPEKIYFEVLKEKFGLKAVNGYGVGGTRIARQKNVSPDPIWDEYFSLRADSMTLDADAVVVFGGTNDYGHGLAPMGAFEDRSLDTFYGACHELFEKLINMYPGKPIIIMTPLHRATELTPVEKADGAKYILSDYVKVIREVAEFYSLPVCDLYAKSGIQPAIEVLKEKFCPDGLHPNDAGHNLIAERLGNFLISL